MTNPYRLPKSIGFKPDKSAGKTIPADDPHGLNVKEKFELRDVKDWDIFDLWNFIISFPQVNAKKMPKKGSMHTKNMKELVARVKMEAAKEVGEFYAVNWKKLHKHLEWQHPANPTQFAYSFDKISYCMEFGFKKHGNADRIGNKTADDYKDEWA